jgi:hypothetical protein
VGTVDRIESADAARAFVEAHGVVLFAARGQAPNLVEAIAGEPIGASWWGHPAGKRIFRIASELGDSPDILWCRLLGGKRTLVHRRLWPALARLAGEIDPDRIASVRQEHTESGAHRNIVEPFVKSVPPEVLEAARSLTRAEALSMLPSEALADKARSSGARTRKRKARAAR